MLERNVPEGIPFTHFTEIEWIRKVTLPKQKLGNYKFVEKATEEITQIGEAEGEQFADFMDLPEDFKKAPGPMFPAMFPPIPGMMLPVGFPTQPGFGVPRT